MATVAHWAHELAEEGALRERLAATCEIPPGRRERIAIGVSAGTRAAIACAGGRRSPRSRIGEAKAACRDASLTMRTGCLTKLFTAALARKACAAGQLALDDRIADVLGSIGASALGDVTVRQLLEHTHGLDDSLLDSAPRRGDGFIDAPRLAADLGAAERLAKPGELYSYSNAGAWLIAALLERASGRRYAELLHEGLFAPSAIEWLPGPSERTAGPSSDAASSARICPAVGRMLSVSVAGMLAFLRAHGLGRAGGEPALALVGEGQEIVPLPGWNALERGARLGWKHHGMGWFGHASVWPKASAIVRVQPAEGVALVIVSTGRPAAAVAAGVLGAALPELAGLRIPRPLSVEQAECLDPRCYAGTYCSARHCVVVASAGGRRLELHAFRRDANGRICGPGLHAPLRPAESHLFFTGPPPSESFPYVQFVVPRAGRFRFLWNGRFVLRRRSTG